ncbi:acyl-CoA synthetase [Actinokineospora sp. PR83]|uniref:acyl-CoA synthetase n=1 Tax=Actinokineospora sp. PR83 TaxID=2884908 RepID=UPI0027E1335D|nr:acyl-CoA synthetase [Actinokineospora sp. PR83]MCG8914512.1 acyl-CoA synthetase [Actinokineospora sp. PR83]
MSAANATGQAWWPTYRAPDDLAAVEEVPLADRGLPATTYDLLRHAVQQRGDKTALVVMPDAARWRDAVERTFADVLRDVHRYANALHALGVRRTDAVTLMAPNCAELIPAVLAAQLAGIAAPVNGALTAEHVSQLIRRSGSRTLIAAGPELDPAVWETATSLAASGDVDTVLVVRPTAARGRAPELRLPGVVVEHLHDFAADRPDDHFAGRPPAATDLAAIFHTGGTTGLPKLAAHTHRNEVVDAWMLAANDLLDEDARIFAALPLFHVNALVVTLLAPMFKAQTAIWAGPLGYRDVDLYGCFWQVVEHHRISTMSAVPTVYAVLAQVPVDARIDSMVCAVVGAAALPDAVRTGFERHTGVPLLEGYGLTEATCASVRGFVDARRPGSVGQRLPYQRVKAVQVEDDGSWTDLPPGGRGVLAIAGPTVFGGYVVGRDEGGLVLDGQGKLVDGWLDTGDLGSVDEDGFVHLAGRAKDLIIRGGHNIDPAAVEDVLLAHPDVTGASVVGEPDEHAGEVPVAFVTVAAGAAVGPEEILEWASGRVAERAAAPRRVTVLDALPLTDIGKPHKLGLRARAAQEVLAQRLRDVDGVHDVSADVVDGDVVVSVVVDGGDTAPDARAAAESVLGRFAVRSRVRELS